MGKEKYKEVYVVGDKQFYGATVFKKGIFDLEEMYKKFKDWFEKHHYHYNEKKQSAKTLPDGKEIKTEWIGERKVDEYVKFHIGFFVWIRRCTDVIVETEAGKKEKMQKGEISIRFKGYMEKDYMKKWKSEFFRQLYDRYIIKGRLEQMEGKIWFETNDLISMAKRYCQLMLPA